MARTFVSVPMHLDVVPEAVDAAAGWRTEPLNPLDASLLESALTYVETRVESGAVEYVHAMTTDGALRAYGNLMQVALLLSKELSARFDQGEPQPGA